VNYDYGQNNLFRIYHRFFSIITVIINLIGQQAMVLLHKFIFLEVFMALRRVKVLLALLTATCLIFVACSNDNGNGGGNGGGGENGGDFSGLAELRLNERVFGTQGSAPLAVSALGATGTITNGLLNFTIGTPNSSFLDNLTVDALVLSQELWFPEDYSNITISDNSAMFVELSIRLGNGCPLYKFYGTYDEEITGEIIYLYVDRNVVINGRGKTSVYDDGVVISKDFTLNLKKGWNIINLKSEWASDADTVAVSLGDVKETDWDFAVWEITYGCSPWFGQ